MEHPFFSLGVLSLLSIQEEKNDTVDWDRGNFAFHI
jgi:hypothetical protein